jgi:hypothetical protein
VVEGTEAAGKSPDPIEAPGPVDEAEGDPKVGIPSAEESSGFAASPLHPTNTSSVSAGRSTDCAALAGCFRGVRAITDSVIVGATHVLFFFRPGSRNTRGTQRTPLPTAADYCSGGDITPLPTGAPPAECKSARGSSREPRTAIVASSTSDTCTWKEVRRQSGSTHRGPWRQTVGLNVVVRVTPVLVGRCLSWVNVSQGNTSATPRSKTNQNWLRRASGRNEDRPPGGDRSSRVLGCSP